MFRSQYLVKFKCHFSWQAQHVVNVGMQDWARNVAFFNRKMLVASLKSNLGCEAGCGLTVSWSDHGQIMVGSSPHWK